MVPVIRMTKEERQALSGDFIGNFQEHQPYIPLLLP
jgi:hypothetical protein